MEAIQSLCLDKNVALFEKMSVMSKEETLARATAMHDQYAGIVEIELKVMIEMITRKCIPACKQAGCKARALPLRPSPALES